MSVFQDLYDSEINITVSTFWDGGYDVKLGDHINGFVAESNFDRIGMVESWLISAAIEHYPKSAFAKMYRDGMSKYQAERACGRKP